MSLLKEGFLSVSVKHRIYYAEYGNPHGPVACVVHGGPGSGCRPSMLSWFDLHYWRVVLMDQRGSGLSQPLGDIAENTTSDLVHDMELLRQHLQIEKWLLVGGSWGTIPALLYGSQYKNHTSGIVLRGVFLARPKEMQWFFQSLQQLVPEGWRRLTKNWTVFQQHNVLKTLTHAILHADREMQQEMVYRWSCYEESVMSAMTGEVIALPSIHQVSDKVIAKYRIQAHYLQNNCFVNTRQLLRAAQQLADLKTVIVHGTHDWICPPDNARLLHYFMPEAELVWVTHGTHTPGDPLILNALQQAIKEFVD